MAGATTSALSLAGSAIQRSAETPFASPNCPRPADEQSRRSAATWRRLERATIAQSSPLNLEVAVTLQVHRESLARAEEPSYLCSVHTMTGAGDEPFRRAEKAERRAARELIATYHQTQLRALLDHVRAGFVQFDAGEIDEFELDGLIHHYKRSAAELWKFCGSTGGQWLQAARTLSYLHERGEEPDWWDAGASRRDRSL